MTPAGADGEIKVSVTVAVTGLLTNKKNIKFVENKKACKQPERLSFFFLDLHKAKFLKTLTNLLA